MFNGTTIDELLEIVERAEEHAQTTEFQSTVVKSELYPGFLAGMMNTNQEWLGVA